MFLETSMRLLEARMSFTRSTWSHQESPVSSMDKDFPPPGTSWLSRHTLSGTVKQLYEHLNVDI